MLLQLEGLCVAYGTRRVLEDMTLRVGQGEIVSLLGGNASGKTTTLKSIIGLTRVVAGVVRIAGKDITGMPTHVIVANGIAIVPENRRLFRNLTVMENLQVAQSRGMARRDWERARDQSRELFPFLRDHARMGQRAGTLSGGEQQQVAMARAVLRRPRLLLLDEPSMGMSADLVRDNFGIVKRIAEMGVGVLMVEQNVRAALSIADRAYVLQGGRLLAEGRASDLLASDLIKRAYMGEFVQWTSG